MSCGCQTCGQTLCGCCSGATRLTPALIVNRSLLPAISYRVGTYSSFMQTMIAALSRSNVPALTGLRTRDSSDFSIALVDAWSEVLDILTFYTERLANEAYLGTAVQARSVFELVNLVGYTPSPGVSASTTLVFTLATSPGSPATVPIPQGTRVQSVPGPGQTPQVFETSEDLTATIAANAIPAATTQPWTTTGKDTSTWIAGTANNIQVGNALLFISTSGGAPSITGPAILCFVTAVVIDPLSGNTQIFWDQQLPFGAGDSSICLYVLRTKAALFGVNAPWPGIFPYVQETSSPWNFVPPNIPGYPTNPSNDWSFTPTDSATINLDNSYPGLNPAGGASASASQAEWAVLKSPGPPASVAFFQIQSASESNPALYTVSAKTTQLTMASGAAIVPSSPANTDVSSLLSTFVNNTRKTTVYIGSQLLTFANLPLTALTPSPTGDYADTLMPGMLAPVSGGSFAIVGLQQIGPNSPIGVNGKRLRIAPNTANATFISTGASSGLTVSLNQPFLVDAFPPTPDPDGSGNDLWSVITVNGEAGILSVAPGAYQLQPSATADPIAGEAATVTIATVEGASTALTLGADLSRIYDASTVTVNANAVLATDGQTTQEILGSGDATNPALEFQLKQSPLTYTAAANSSGVQSTLQVRVNNLLWSEAPNFLSSAPSDRAYVTIPNSTGGPTVQFGNGIQGSRTPTGQANIQALYRVGIGAAGNLAAGQLTQALDRPQGLQSVTNPGIATGGADPATPAEARESAPLPTLTLGRVVTLEDYQNFALNIPGISLALATWTWFGNTRGIFLTVAGAEGATLLPTDQVVVNLYQAIANCSLPYVPVRIVSYVPGLFEISMQVLVNTPLYEASVVMQQVWQSLAAAFAFGQLAPAQGVAASQVIALAQQVPGVVAVNLTALNRKGDSATATNFLCASGPQPTADPPAGAEILLLDPASQGNAAVWS
jgi:Baseplate J-like protein